MSPIDDAERRFLAPLDQEAAKKLKDALRAVLQPETREQATRADGR